MSKITKIAVPGLFCGVLLGIGCQDDEAATAEIDMACNDYCEARTECDDEADFDDCLGRCFNNLNECDADELDEAIADVERCSMESCDDVLECPVWNLVECRF